MKVTKENLNLMYHDGQWYCEIFVGSGFKWLHAWGWSESAKQAAYIARAKVK